MAASVLFYLYFIDMQYCLVHDAALLDLLFAFLIMYIEYLSFHILVFPIPICLKSVACCYLILHHYKEMWPDLHNSLYRGKTSSFSFFASLFLVPSLWACCNSAPIIRMDCQYFFITLVLHLHLKSCLGGEKEVLLQVLQSCCQEQ